MAGLANITSHPHYFDKVVPRDQSFSEDFAGIFHFRYNINFKTLIDFAFITLNKVK